MDPLHATLTAELERDPKVTTAWLFGSRARGTARAKSDVDVAVLYDGPWLSDWGLALPDLHDRLEASLRLPVDLLVVNEGPWDLVHRVLRDGVLLIDRDRSFRIQWTIRARNLWFDMAPHRRLVRRSA